MGYEIHITRAPEDRFANQGHEITVEEWLALVERDPELRLAGYNGSYFTLWSGRSRHPDAWFNWRKGNIHTKSPDPPLIQKAIEIAEALGARVLGDDGELYLRDGQVMQDGTVDDRPDMDWRQW